VLCSLLLKPVLLPVAPAVQRAGVRIVRRSFLPHARHPIRSTMESDEPPYARFSRSSFSKPADRFSGTSSSASAYSDPETDADPERSFDRVLDLATRLFEVPMGIGSLHANGQPRVVATDGLRDAGLQNEDDGGKARLCTRTLQSPGATVVTDATDDSRLAEHPWVAGGPGFASTPVPRWWARRATELERCASWTPRPNPLPPRTSTGLRASPR
jgi:hypothetical protein